MAEYHEPVEELDAGTRDYHRAIKSLMEELEAVDWYQQRVATATDEELRRILAHNRDEEIEHACMVLEWLRRNMPGWEENLRTYLFQDPAVSIVAIEQDAEQGEASTEPAVKPGPNPGATQDLGIGTLKE
ncbi:MAG TPA: ferritin-like domain-containing protein [Candidatus Obscuribacterales bacterium]